MKQEPTKCVDPRNSLHAPMRYAPNEREMPLGIEIENDF